LGGILNEIRGRMRSYIFVKTLLFDRPRTYFQFDSKLYVDSSKVDACVDKINRLDRASRARGVDFRVVLLPYEFQVRKKTISEIIPESQMETRLKETGVETLNLLPFMQSCGVDSRKLYLFGDGIHFSRLGHWLIAECILQDRL
jgi:hypothetical protein